MKQPLPMPELLAPAGGREQFEAAILYGAKAVYLGGSELNLRAASHGFGEDDLPRAVAFAHAAGVRVYYCLNALPGSQMLGAVEAVLERLPHSGVDGLIVADPGVLAMARRLCPQLPLHLSTQAHTVNSEAVRFWQDYGVMRVNLARELDYTSIRAMLAANPAMEFEVFTHGALCLALSGHCLMSAWLNKRHANMGACTHPCRYEYREFALEERTREGEALWEARVYEDASAGAFGSIWAPHDQCLIRFVPWLMRAGVHALKIEGRTKSASYVAQVVDVYRTALDAAFAGQALPKAAVPELLDAAVRPLSTGFFLPGKRRIVGERQEGAPRRQIVARLEEALAPGTWRVSVRARWSSGQSAHILLPGMLRPELAPGTYSLENHRGDTAQVVHSGTSAILHCEVPGLRSGLFVKSG